MAQKKTRGEPSAERFANVAIWCNRHGWIEVPTSGRTTCSPGRCTRAVWPGVGEAPYATIDDALHALDGGIKAFMEENGWE